MPGEAAVRIDGRLARSERSRRAVVDAMLDLIESGDERPTAARIAERAGVSLRSVFQHFENLEVLLATAADRQFARLRPLLKPIDLDGTRADRLRIFAARRARLLESLAPVRRAALREEARSPVIAHRLRRFRELGRLEVERVFARELAALGEVDRRDAVSSLAAAASFSTWDELRRHQELSPARARRVLARMLDRLVPGGP
ncbi:MAG TPA: TetR/AcrR family transcriptional regulator [Candidatus Binatia bacterium]|nr:TetR/AcrR family transcriptional regulator [Candidatus Binatia bacterium]